ncbi:hydrogenase-4 component B [Propionispira arboris]|uniref:Hydrogenase-4 component B n=1 Tax=Propionispira arboris TaxID=84035 RepID=A0A1H6ZSG9_9FIRM|nr:proton-conducting transporter membrane subunit [Propionispira arboris]SEJ55124.1 hydrogenase-4 component B [Propionispira arboris]
MFLLTQDLFNNLFELGVLFFILGGIFPLLLHKWQHFATAFANGCSFVGGVLMTIVAGRLLLFQETLNLTAWTIMDPIILKVHFDMLSSFFLLIIGSMVLICAIYAQGDVVSNKQLDGRNYLGAIMNFFILSLIGVVGVDTSVTFLIFWEFMALTSFALVIFEHEKKKVRSAGYIYLTMTHVIGVCLSIAFLLLYWYTGSLEFAAYKNIGSQVSELTGSIIFFLFFIGFAAKMGLFPINVWLPRAYPAAPSSATTLMASAMIKMPVYALLRVSFDFFGTGPLWWGLCLIGIGTVSMFAGSLLGALQNDTKRFLAYSSVENMGLLCVGIGASLYFNAVGAFTLAALAFSGTLYHVFSHCIFKSLLFMGAGVMLRATGTCNISRLGGLIHRMPWTAGAFLIGGMTLASLPPFTGFMSEWLLLQSMLHMAFEPSTPFIKLFAAMVVAAMGLSGALAAAAVVKHFGIAFLGKARTPAAAEMQDVNGSMRVGMMVLCFLSLVLGIYPGGAFLFINAVTSGYFSVVFKSDFIVLVPFVGAAEKLTLSTGIVAGLIFVILLFTYLLIRRLYGRSRYELEFVWTCGGEHLPVMEYTAASYSQPLLRIFKRILGAHNKIVTQAEYQYYPKRIEHRINIDARVGDNVYKPCIGLMVKLFKQVKIIQNGNLQAYVAYMVAALIITLLWIR